MAAKRTVCPICGYNAADPAASVDKLAKVAAPVTASNARAKRLDKVICPECMNSFPPEEIVDAEGRRICQSCAAVLEKKGKKVAATKKEEAKDHKDHKEHK